MLGSVTKTTGRAFAAVVLCLALLPGVAESGPLDHPDYRGKLRSDNRAKVVIELKRNGTRAIFQARDVRLVCDDRRTRHTFAPVRARVQRDGSFEYDAYRVGPGSAEPDQSFYWVTGSLVTGRNARGFILATFDPWDPPGQDNLPECTTLGKLRWKARRTG